MSNIDFSKVLVKFSNSAKDFWTIDDAVKGVSIIGGTGSGKTSASGKTLALKYLKEGWGGIVLCAKTDEVDNWKSYCKKAGREKDLIIFGKNAVHEEGEFKGKLKVFNPLHYEMNRPGDGAGETQNLSNIFMNMYRMGNRISGDGGDAKEERYWDLALKRCLNRIIELVKLSGQELTFENMVKILTTTKGLNEDKLKAEKAYLETSKGDRSRLKKDHNYCLSCLMEVYYTAYSDIKKPTPEKKRDCELVLDYFLIDMPGMGDKTKSVVVESFMGIAEPFLSGLLASHFSGVTNIFPEDTYTKNKIIVLDFSIKEFLDAGIIAQCIFKLLFQQSIERRDVKKYPTPVFLWADEAQYFVNSYDQTFLTTARSSRTATVFLSQNISNYYGVLGASDAGKAKTDSLMGNLSTKIFHANSDAVTNEYASKLIGQTISLMSGRSLSSTLLSFNFTSQKSTSTQFLPQVQPKDFTLLKSGGDNNQFQVDAIVFVTGKQWSAGSNFIKTTYIQDFS